MLFEPMICAINLCIMWKIGDQFYAKSWDAINEWLYKYLIFKEKNAKMVVNTDKSDTPITH